MTTAAQRERTDLRQKLYTGRMTPGSGRGGLEIPESSCDARRPGRVQLWPTYLDHERTAAKPTLTLVGVKEMLDEEKTPAFKGFAPRPLSSGEVDVILAWYQKAQQQEEEILGNALAAAQGNIMTQAAANHDEVMEKLRGHGEILQRLDTQTKSSRELQRAATKRKQEERRDKYHAVLLSVGRPLPEELLQSVAEYKARVREPTLLAAVAEKKAAREQIEARDELDALLRYVGRPVLSEPLRSAAEYKERLREPALLAAVAEKKAEDAAAAKARREEAANLKRKRPQELKDLCDELGVERGNKKQMVQSIIEKRATAALGNADAAGAGAAPGTGLAGAAAS